MAALDAGKSAFTTAGVKLDGTLSRQRYVIFNLLYYRLDKAHYRAAWGSDLADDFSGKLDALVSDGLMRDAGDAYRLTELGKLWLQNVMLEFFDDGMWENSAALAQQQSSWAMNNHMIDIGASSKAHWLERA